MRKRLPMTGWYNPLVLVRTGIRVAVSTVFGEFADRREAIAASNAIAAQPIDPSFDYSNAVAHGAEFWLDFLADTGDGWEPTFAMAQLVTEPRLTIGEHDLPRGRLLVLGGDQVYPTASRKAYDERFLGPFEEALDRLDESSRKEMPDLYAVPGNHDWYDGLSAFFNLFCRRRITLPNALGIDRPGRIIAGRRTMQTRSYFAVRLPYGWWLWGTDSQLKGHIDQPQIDFFQWVAREWMDPGSKLILCVGQPNWAYIDIADPGPEFSTLSYLERLAGMARTSEGHPKQLQLKLVLTGDSHHYCRYVSENIQYLTCGGGGAFLHPTHHLEDKEFEWKYPPPGIPANDATGPYRRKFTISQKMHGAEEALYPDRTTSRGLTKRNLFFARHNPGMLVVYGLAYLVFNWLLEVNARTTGHESFIAALSDPTIAASVLSYVKLLFASPWSFLLMGAAFGGYYYFADDHHGPKRFFIGFAHWAAQTLTAVITTCIAVKLITTVWGAPVPGDAESWSGVLRNVAALLSGSILAAVVSATIFGIYLWVSLNCFGHHWNEAFSALTVKDFKNFLRMRIDPDGRLHLYPIGLNTVPPEGGNDPSLKPHLIEGPVTIS
jgi:hypothetical protein